MDIVLEARDIFFAYDERPIFQGLDFQLRREEIYVVLGKSGGGKSVFLKLLSGLLVPEKGSVQVNGMDLATASKESLKALRARMGFVFQEAALISNMSIYDNVALPLRYHSDLTEPEVRARVAEMMALFEVDRKYDPLLPAQLSLGLRKRTALARALVLGPDLVFLDEPAIGLGAETDRLLARVWQHCRTKTHTSLVVATGEWLLAFELADRFGLLGNGKIMAEGGPQEMQAKLKKLAESGFPSMN